MGNQPSIIKKVNFEDIQNVLQKKLSDVLLINTLDNTPEDQSCILPGTLDFTREEEVINTCLNSAKEIKIIIYGKNSGDAKIYEKYTQLVELGFTNVYIYPGGMFEWMLLQDIFSDEHFKTTSQELDILKFKPKSVMNTEYSYQIRS
jgi:rhodanese-related sulfurtransferase